MKSLNQLNLNHRKKIKKPVEKVSTIQTEILDAEILDTTIVEQAGGKYEVDWPLIGMDCPDCASKQCVGYLISNR